MLYERFFLKLTEKIKAIELDERGVIDEVALKSADSLQNRGVLHIFDTGHLVNQELVNRAGGMAAMARLTFNYNVDNTYTFLAGERAHFSLEARPIVN